MKGIDSIITIIATTKEELNDFISFYNMPQARIIDSNGIFKAYMTSLSDKSKIQAKNERGAGRKKKIISKTRQEIEECLCNGQTKKSLAEELNISRTTLYNILNGK